jgi:signal transduction histidine kinase
MNAQITRVIAAARSVGPRQAVGTSTPILPAIGRLFDVMRRLPGGDVIDWRLEGASAGTSLPIDQRDLEEMLGNLLDNCRKWARSKVKVTVEAGDGPFRILVEDDGPGIPEDRLEDVLSGGFRLDRTVPGTGIGLAIATDLATLHGGKLEIGPSPLGGTKVMFSMGPA